MSIVKNAIFGLKGLSLTDEERHFFASVNPLGFILFARNIDTPEQVKALVSDLKSIVTHTHCLILIDQEGGRVARLRPPHWPEFPPMEYFADMAEQDGIGVAEHAVYQNGVALGQMLADLGINVNCAPVCDLYFPEAHEIISDRSFGSDPYFVASMSDRFSQGMFEQGVLPIIKHIPGHGRAGVDSHEDLPKVMTDLETLEKSDFKAFELLNNYPLAMTAHIIFTALDDTACVTFSPAVISYIRNTIGFAGLIMTDDLSMKALTGDFATRTKKAIAAGCDIILHCNGDMDEMQAVASELIECVVSDEIFSGTLKELREENVS